MKASEIRNVVIIGNGTMAVGIAQTFAQAGRDVSIVGRSEASLDNAMRKIKDNVELFVEMDCVPPEERQHVLSRIHPTTNMEAACAQADYLIEAVIEVMELKKQIFRQVDAWCPVDAILTSTVSTLSVGEIGSVTKRSDRVVGTHFIHPAHIMQLVEIVRGPATSDETITTTRELLEGIGKVTALCKDSPGFMHNAMQYALSKVAMDLLERGITTAEEIDKAAIHGLGLRMTSIGPVGRLNMSGIAGFKRNWESINAVTGSLGPFPAMLEKLLAQGRVGLKEYSEDEKRNLTKERNRQLIRNLKALGRIR